MQVSFGRKGKLGGLKLGLCSGAVKTCAMSNAKPLDGRKSCEAVTASAKGATAGRCGRRCAIPAKDSSETSTGRDAKAGRSESVAI